MHRVVIRCPSSHVFSFRMFLFHAGALRGQQFRPGDFGCFGDDTKGFPQAQCAVDPAGHQCDCGYEGHRNRAQAGQVFKECKTGKPNKTKIIKLMGKMQGYEKEFADPAAVEGWDTLGHPQLVKEVGTICGEVPRAAKE